MIVGEIHNNVNEERALPNNITGTEIHKYAPQLFQNLLLKKSGTI